MTLDQAPPVGTGRTAGTPLLAIEGLAVEFWNGSEYERVVEDASLQIAPGEAVGLVGESGCGKTTTAYSVLGYFQPGSRVRSGRVLVRGRNVLELSGNELRSLRGGTIGHVPQDPTLALNPNMRVGSQIVETLINHSSGGDRSARAYSLLASVGIADPEAVYRRYPCQLSGGQQQRIMIAMAVACEPDLVVLDEPTTGLDVTSQALVLELLKELRATRGASMLYVSHDLGVVAELCDRVVVMYGGKVVESAATAELFAAPRHPYTRALIDSVPTLASSAGPGQGLRGRFERKKVPAGCPFAPRCRFALERCSSEPQVLSEISADHLVACWRSDTVALDEPSRVVAAPSEERVHYGEGLKVSSLSCSYGRPTRWSGRRRNDAVVRDVSFAIARGETVALVGESGSGKSTVARAVAGLLAPSGGEIAFEGAPLAGTVARRTPQQLRSVQLVFQNPDASLNPRHTVGRIIGRALSHYFDLSGTEVKERTERLLADVQLDERLASRYPRELSGGERQRVAIARALAAEPALLLCDEVLSALDVSVQASMVSLLRKLQLEHRFSMLFISHDLAVVRWLADEVVVLYRGAVCEAGPTERIFASPLHPYTATLLAAIPGAARAEHAPTLAREGGAGMGGQGCTIASRCPFHIGPVCDQVAPAELIDDGGRRVRCHLTLPDLRQRMLPHGVAR